MVKKLLYNLFGLGRFPGKIRAAMDAEGILFLEEGIKVSITLKKYRNYVRCCSWKRSWVLGSIAMTSRRLRAFAFSSTLLDIALDDPMFKHLEIRNDGSGCLLIGFEASSFRKDTTGRVEYRFHLPRVKSRLALIERYCPCFSEF